MLAVYVGLNRINLLEMIQGREVGRGSLSAVAEDSGWKCHASMLVQALEVNAAFF